MRWPTRPLTYVDATAYESILSERRSDKWLRNLFSWHNVVNAEVGEAWQGALFLRHPGCGALVLDATKRHLERPP